MNELFRLRSAGPEAGDCTAPYDVFFNHPCTVKGFVEYVLTRNEWGYIGVRSYGHTFGNPLCKYKGDRLTSEALPRNVLLKPVKSASAHGGWTRMDYLIDVEDD